MFHWMILGEIDALFGISSIFLALGLGYVTIKPPVAWLSPVCFFAVILLVIAFPILQRTLQARELAKIDIEKIEDLCENLALRPDNLSAKFRLAEVLWHRGIHAHAVGLAESILPQMNPNLFRSEHQAVSQWRRQLGGSFVPRPVKCLECGHFNPPGDHTCAKCRAPYLLLYARTAWLGPSIGRRILGTWIIAVVVIVGIPSTASLGLPTPVTVSLVIAEMALGLVILLGSFHDRARA